MSVWSETQTVETSLMVTLSQEKNSELALRITERQRDCQQEVPEAARVTSRMADLRHPGRWQLWPQSLCLYNRDSISTPSIRWKDQRGIRCLHAAAATASQWGRYPGCIIRNSSYSLSSRKILKLNWSPNEEFWRKKVTSSSMRSLVCFEK